MPWRGDVDLWDECLHNYQPIWNPLLQEWQYPWFTRDSNNTVEWLTATVWMYRHNNRELFDRSPYRLPTPSDDGSAAGIDGTVFTKL